MLYAKGFALYGNPITFLCLGVSGLACLSILLWPFVAYTSIFLFDSPDSENNPFVWFAAFLMLSYPLTVALGTFISWKAHTSTNSLKALAGVLISSVNYLLLFVYFNAW